MKHLSERQRYEIYGLIQAGFNQKGIAAEAAGEIIDILNDLAAVGLVKTITSDNGLQFARHDVVSRELGVGFYFAHPYHSWERGSNENTNGLARQYLPKGSDFEHITDDYLEYVENMLNSRPRRRFGFRSPDEMFRKLTGLDGMMYV
jgi:IS30 family transposase